MSWIALPDDHQGRCLNFRQAMSEVGPTTVRCLEREDDLTHHCRFPPVPRLSPSRGWSSRSTKKPEPEPWVPPPREEN